MTEIEKYHQKYQQRRRKEIIEGLGSKCSKCGSTENLEIHHKEGRERFRDYIKNGYDLTKLDLLCLKCHKKAHFKYGKFKTIKTDEKTFEYITFIASRLNWKKTVLMRRLFKELFDVCSDLKKESANIFFDSHRGQLILTIFGDSYLEFGTIRSPNAEAEAKEKPIIRDLRKSKKFLKLGEET